MYIVKNIICRTTVIMLLMLTIVSCSVTQKAIKENNPQQLYDLALQEYENGRYSKATELFGYAEPYYSNSSRDDSLKFNKARSVFKDADYEYAISLFEDYRRRYSHSVLIEDAEGMYTLSHYYRAPSARRDPTLTKTAISAINEYLSRYPFSDKKAEFENMRDELVSRLHEKAFLNAYTYYKIGYYKSAIVAFKNANVTYPQSTHREKVSYYIVASAFKLADNSVSHKKEDRFLQMMDSYYTFISEFPESEYRKDVDNMMEKARQFIDKANPETKEEAEESVEAEDNKESKEAEEDNKEVEKPTKKEKKVKS